MVLLMIQHDIDAGLQLLTVVVDAEKLQLQVLQLDMCRVRVFGVSHNPNRQLGSICRACPRSTLPSCPCRVCQSICHPLNITKKQESSEGSWIMLSSNTHAVNSSLDYPGTVCAVYCHHPVTLLCNRCHSVAHCCCKGVNWSSTQFHTICLSGFPEYQPLVALVGPALQPVSHCCCQ